MEVLSLVSYNVVMPSPLEKLVTDFLEHLEIEKGRTEKTVRNYDFYLRRFLDFSELTSPSGITLDTVRKFRVWLNRDVAGREEANIKKSTQNYHLIALRSFLKYLSKRDVKSLAPEKVELAKQSMRQVEFLEPEELDRLLAVPLAGKGADELPLVHLRNKAILEMLFATGLRVSELAGLLVERVNLKQDEFTVKGKGGKTRVVFLNDETKGWIKKYLEKRTDTLPYLFVGHDRAGAHREESKALTSRSIQRIVEAAARDAGITKRITPHVMRHTYATTLLRNGADIRSVQAMLGHSSITTTQIYTHITDKGLREVHKKFHKK